MHRIILIFFLLTLNTVYAAPELVSWYNNNTLDVATNISTTTENSIFFNATANETVNWTWTLDGVVKDTDIDTNSGEWSYNFPDYGTYNIGASGTNENGATQSVNWTITSVFNFTDALGNSISIKTTPQKIVSLAPSNTEILFALGLGDSVVGVTSYCNYPPEASSKTSVGGFQNPNVEGVEILGADLILASSGNDEITVNKLIDDCANLNCTLASIRAETIDAIMDNIELVGKITNADYVDLKNEINSRINAVEGNTSGLSEEEKPDVFYVIWDDPLYTGGNGTFAHDLIQKAGGKNIASDLDGWQMMNAEVVLSRNPDVIICSGMGGSGSSICSNLKNDAAIKYVDAVVNNRMYVVGDSNIVERPGPRIASGLETIYAFLNFPQGEVSQATVSTTSPLATSYAYGSTITVSYTTGASTPISFYRLDDGFITSFESDAATISPASGSHTITVWVRDANGDWGSDTMSFSVDSPPAQSSPGGGPSSSPAKPTATASEGGAVVSIPGISAGSTVSVQIPDAKDVDVTEISLKPKSSVSSVKITVKSMDSAPGEVSPLGVTAYGYMDISHQNIEDENIDELVIKFKVELEWMEEHGVDAQNIKLERYHDGTWNELPTSITREDPTYIYYTANSPGLSLFAITNRITEPVPITLPPVETSPPVTELPSITPSPTASPITPPAEIPKASQGQDEISEKKGICGPTVMPLIGLLPAILIFLLRKKL